MNVQLKRILPLENGDRLSRDEFERRYNAMPDVKKAELIEGEVFMPSPVRQEGHGKQHLDLITLFGIYRAFTPGVVAGDNATVRLDLDNVPQPDGVMYIERSRGGRSQIDQDGYLTGTPELVAEVAASSASLDLAAKKTVYRRNGVQEYLVWRVFEEAVDWFALRGSQYEALSPDADGVLKSEVFSGFWLDVPALLKEDMRRVHDVLRRGLDSPEHQVFVEKLRAAAP